MATLFDRSKSLILLGAATCALTGLAGCGGSGSPAAATPQAAKTMYIGNYASDPNNNDVETDTIVGYSTTAPGSTTPSTTLNLPNNFVLDAFTTGPDGKLYVSGNVRPNRYDEILVFAAGATGSATPVTTITGSATENNGTFTYAYYLAVNSKNQLFVLNDDNNIEVFAAGATGAAVPAQYITWGSQNDNFDEIYDIATDGLGETFICDYGNNEIFAFAAGATGNIAPVRTITGTNVDTFDSIWAMTADDAGNVYTVNYNSSDDPGRDGNGTPHPMLASHHPHRHGQTLTAHPHTGNPSGTLSTGIIVFPAGATGNATPLRTISGSTTKVFYPAGIAVDPVSNIYYIDDDVSPLGPLMMFSSTATGDIAPVLSISLSNLPDPFWGLVATY
jgi:hypothetical protein